MQIIVDADSRRLSLGPTPPVRGETIPGTLTFMKGGVPFRLPAGTAIQIGVKSWNDPSDVLLAYTTATRPEPDGAPYTFSLSLNTSEMLAKFTAGVTRYDCSIEVKWEVSAGSGTFKKTQRHKYSVDADTVRDTDANPSTMLSRNDFLVTNGTGLLVNVAAGYAANGAFVAAQSSLAITNATNYIEVTAAGVASVNTTAFTAGSYPLATVVASAGAITANTDLRAWITPKPAAGGVTSITGTANEITVTGTTTPTLSLPSALTFTGKTVTGGTFASPTLTTPTIGDGTEAAPSLSFTSDTNTGVYRPAADTVGIVGGGHDILRLTDVASATDYLEIKNGIGVGSPLHVLAEGASANIGMHLQPKGSGLLTISDGTDFNKGIRFRSSSSAASAITLLDAVSTAGRVITLPDATGTLALVSGALGTPASGDFSTGAFIWPTFDQNTTGSAATLTTTRTIGGSNFDGSADVTSFPSPGAIGGTTPSTIAGTTGTFSGDLITTGANAQIYTSGAAAYLATYGDAAHIYTDGANAQIYTSGLNARISTGGANAHISTGSSGAHIQTRSTFKLFGGTYYTTLSHAATADRAIAFPDAAGTLLLADGSGANLTALNASNISSGTLAAARGGTGVSNTGTITLGGNLVTTGAFNTTFAQAATTTVTLPATSATMARTDAAQTFTGVQSMTSPDITTSITTPNTTFAIANATATTLNIGGAATTIAMGNASGTNTILGTTVLTTLKTAKIVPPADSTTATQVTKADGTTVVSSWDTTNTRLGMGTTAPATMMHLATEASALGYGNGMRIQWADATASNRPVVEFYRSRGTVASPTAVAANDVLGSFSFVSYTGSNVYSATVRVDAENTSGYGKFAFFTTGADGEQIRMTMASTGVVAMLANVTSSSTTTGTLVVTGGQGISGALNVGGTLAVTGATTLSGGLAVNTTGSITTNQTTFAIANTTATTLNIGGAATTIAIGAAGAGTMNIPLTTAASSAITGSLKIGNGTAATNVGIGGGNINAGGTLTVGGTGSFTGSVGIGSAAPVSQLHVTTNALNSTRGVVIDQHSTDAGGALSFFRKSRGTLASPTTVANGDYVGAFNFSGYTSNGAYTNPVGFGARVNGTVTSTSIPTDIFFGLSSGVHDEDAYTNGNVKLILKSTSVAAFSSSMVLGITSSGGANGTVDTGLSRDSAGVWAFGTGAAASLAGSWKATNGTLSGTLITTPEALAPALNAGAACGVTTVASGFALNGVNALTLANGTNGQIKTIVCTAVTAAGTATLTPTTCSGFTTVAFTAAGQTLTLQYFTTGGWHLLSVRGATPA